MARRSRGPVPCSKPSRTARTRASPPMPPNVRKPQSQKRLPTQNRPRDEGRLITRWVTFTEPGWVGFCLPSAVLAASINARNGREALHQSRERDASGSRKRARQTRRPMSDLPSVRDLELDANWSPIIREAAVQIDGKVRPNARRVGGAARWDIWEGRGQLDINLVKSGPA